MAFNSRFFPLKIKHCVSILFCLAACAGWAGSTNQLPQFDEVYQLLRAHLNGASEADLNRAAVEGLLDQLKSSAMLVGGAAPGEPKPPPPRRWANPLFTTIPTPIFACSKWKPIWPAN